MDGGRVAPCHAHELRRGPMLAYGPVRFLDLGVRGARQAERELLRRRAQRRQWRPTHELPRRIG